MATQHNNDEQQRLAEMYTASVDSAGPEAIAAERASAQTYNDNLEGAPILDPWLESQRPDAHSTRPISTRWASTRSWPRSSSPPST